MSFKPCAICKRIKGVSQMYYCSHCDMWLCGNCVRRTFWGEARCPRCGRKLPGR